MQRIHTTEPSSPITKDVTIDTPHPDGTRCDLIAHDGNQGDQADGPSRPEHGISHFVQCVPLADQSIRLLLVRLAQAALPFQRLERLDHRYDGVAGVRKDRERNSGRRCGECLEISGGQERDSAKMKCGSEEGAAYRPWLSAVISSVFMLDNIVLDSPPPCRRRVSRPSTCPLH